MLEAFIEDLCQRCLKIAWIGLLSLVSYGGIHGALIQTAGPPLAGFGNLSCPGSATHTSAQSSSGNSAMRPKSRRLRVTRMAP